MALVVSRGIIPLAVSVRRKGRAMKFTLLAIGKIKEKWMRQGIEEYVKRLKPIAPLEIIAQDEEKCRRIHLLP